MFASFLYWLDIILGVHVMVLIYNTINLVEDIIKNIVKLCHIMKVIE